MTSTLTCDKDNDQQCACSCGTFSARFDIWETDEELVLQGDMPGVDPEGLEIVFENRELTIHGRVKPRYERKDLELEEYEVDGFTRSFMIGDTIDADKIAAELRDGVVTVHLPKKEQVKPRRIKIES